MKFYKNRRNLLKKIGLGVGGLAIISTANKAYGHTMSAGTSTVTYSLLTVLEATTDTRLQVGDTVVIKERANAIFDVVSGQTANSVNIISHQTLPLQLMLQVNNELPVEAFGIFANNTDMSPKLQIAESLTSRLIFSDSDGIYRFDDAIDTTGPLSVEMTNPGVNIRINSGDGWFNVNHSPFVMRGTQNTITHVSRICFLGNDPLKTFSKCELSNFVCERDNVAAERHVFYFPNTPVQDLSIINIIGKDAITPSARLVNSDFINLDWGTSDDTARINVDGLYTFGYRAGFATYGSGFAYGLKTRNVVARSATGQGFRNYHCYYSDLEVQLINCGLPGYAWLGFGFFANLRADNAQTDGWIIEQASCDVNVSGALCTDALCVATWGIANAKITVNSKQNGYALEINPLSNTASSSVLDNASFYVNSTDATNAAINIDNNNNSNHNIRQVDIWPNIVGNNTTSIRGRNLNPGTSVRLHGGTISGDNSVWDLRIAAGVGALYIEASGVNLSCTGSQMVRNDCNAGMNQLMNCKIDDISKLTAWSSLGAFNRYDNCFDRTTNNIVSG